LFPAFANSQPGYNNLLYDFETFFVNQGDDNIEMQSILKKYNINDSILKPSDEDLNKSIKKIYIEWIRLDSLINRANEFTFPNYTKDYQKISNLRNLIDSAITNYNNNLIILNEICNKYPNFDTEEILKSRLDEINALKLPSFKPRYVK
jgi:hypothetical protein